MRGAYIRDWRPPCALQLGSDNVVHARAGMYIKPAIKVADFLVAGYVKLW